MSRVLLAIVAALLWIGVTLGAIALLAPLDVQALEASVQRELVRTQRVVADAEAAEQGRMLDRTTDAAVALGIGAALERLDAPGAAESAKRPRRSSAPLASEQNIDVISELEQQLDDVLREGNLQIAVIGKRGQVLLSVGDAYPLGTDMRNAPLIQDALYGLARLGTDTIGKTQALIAISPTVGKDGASNGALLVAKPIDERECNELAAKTGVTSLALGGLCATGLLKAKTIDGAGVLPLSLDTPSPLLFVDSDRIGLSVLSGPQLQPLLRVPIAVGIDQRPLYQALALRQQRIALVVLGTLLPVFLLLLLASVLATRPAHIIANHLALVHQGGKTPPLQERKFSGGFKRIVKNLNILLEKQPARPALAPISALLQSQEEPRPLSSPDLGPSFEAMPQRPAFMPQPPAPEDRTVQRTVDPAQLDALRDAARSSPMPTLTPSQPATLPPLDLGPSKELGGLFDDKNSAASLRAALSQREEPVSALPPLPDLSEPMPLPPMPAQRAPTPEAPIPLPPAPTPWGNEDRTNVGSSPIMGSASFTVDPDETHFREVFQQFLRVRAECNEPVDSLTYDKFVEKLKKSREQVMQKQNTRSVRFQVYVKDGKAALKAVAAR